MVCIGAWLLGTGDSGAVSAGERSTDELGNGLAAGAGEHANAARAVSRRQASRFTAPR